VIAVDVRGIGETTPPHPDDDLNASFGSSITSKRS